MQQNEKNKHLKHKKIGKKARNSIGVTGNNIWLIKPTFYAKYLWSLLNYITRQPDTKLAMSVLREYAIAAYFAYCRIFRIFQRSAHIAYFPPHKLAFSTAILVLFVFILPISIRFRYLDHLVANRMAPSTCPDPCGTRWGSWFFKQFCIIFPHISTAYLVFMRSAYFLNAA